MKNIECECLRQNVTPKRFYTYCKSKALKSGLDIASFVEYEDWKKPTREESYTTVYKNEDGTNQFSIIKTLPFEWHLYLQGTFNYMMEFEFDTDKIGHGYFYMMEVENDKN